MKIHGRNLVALVLLAGSTYFLGFLVGHKNLEFENGLVPKLVNRELHKPSEVDFSIFWDTFTQVENKYVGQIDLQKLVYGAVEGMVGAVGDPYSIFMEPSTSKRFQDDLSGQFDGIGAEISNRSGKLVIVTPLEGSPAQAAGLLPQDEVLKIDDVDVAQYSLDEAISKIRGKAGTEVSLEISREGFSAPKVFKLKRAKIAVSSVSLEEKEGFGYLKINQFGADTAAAVASFSTQIVDKKLPGLIIDLRNNPGGFLDAAVGVASNFLDDKVVVEEEYKDGKKDTFHTKGIAKLKDIPLVILVNGGSASASEILAGALQDYGRAKLIGEKTFGKGSVQDLVDLQKGATLKITVAKWLTPKGRMINGEGIMPDLKVTLSEDDSKAGRDPQLDQAIKTLKGI